MRSIDNAEDLLVPEFGAATRRATLFPSVFNLVATIVGGGVLSLPLAFSRCGIVMATLLMVGAAIVTDFSLLLLCWSTRRVGVSSYGEVARVAFGPVMELATTALLFIFLLFVIVAYMVLVRDIWSPLIVHVVARQSILLYPNIILLICVLVMSPFMLQRELYALRYNCYVGFISITILCGALSYRASVQLREGTLLLTSDSSSSGPGISDILFSFPIITLSFLSQFNILPIQASLLRPTRFRIELVVHVAVVACFLLMYLFGLGGYLCFGPWTKGNILLNLSNDDNKVIFAGRIGCGVAILMALPMMILPCRRNALELLDTLIDACSIDPAYRPDEAIVLTRATPALSSAARLSRHLQQRTHAADNRWCFLTSTMAIVIGCYLGAFAAPGVAIVWSLCGSCMAFVIAFALPAAFYLQVEKRSMRTMPPESLSPTAMASCTLLAASMIAACACTVYSLLSLQHIDL